MNTVGTDTSLQLAQFALRLEHLQARVQGENIARVGAGSPSLFATQIDAAYRALQGAAESSTTIQALLQGDAQDHFAAVSFVPNENHASVDDLLLAMTRAESRYDALVDGISRQYSLITLAIRGAR